MPESCPKCASPEWKSAKLVVLEGTSNASGTLSGGIVEKGRLRGSAKDFLLANRWFSYDSPLDADFDTTSTTALVDEIRKVLVTEGQKRPMPDAPKEPEKQNPPPEPRTLARDRGKPFTVAPSATSIPKAPHQPEDPVARLGGFESRSWLANFTNHLSSSVLIVGVILIALAFLLPETFGRTVRYTLETYGFVADGTQGFEDIESHLEVHLPVLSTWIAKQEYGYPVQFSIGSLFMLLTLVTLRMVIFLPKSVSVEKKRREKYDGRLLEAEAKREKLLKEHEYRLQKHHNHLKSREDDIAQFQLEKQEYATALTNYENYQNAKMKRYLREVERYEAEVTNVEAYRSELWDRARMCTRCGNSYMGPRLLQAD